MRSRRSPLAHHGYLEQPPQSTADLSVLDVFCGAGGFSEGFRSVGFKIARGIDHWGLAAQTFNCNHNLECEPEDVLDFQGDGEKIDSLPDTDVIVGSPPCVSFSYSNQLGNADKKEGLRLIKTFLAIVAVKKHKRESKLIAWYMENVTNAVAHLSDHYTFYDLGLSSWARKQGIAPRKVAIRIKPQVVILDASDFGVAQNRKRLFITETCTRTARRRGLVVHSQSLRVRGTKVPSTGVRSRLPAANCKKSYRLVKDPVYPAVRIPLAQITDHFYETGAYEIHWRESRQLKVSHPYMGRMTFPENEDKPSRTIVATPFPRSREALLYKSEWGRFGNGEYRGPTVREGASLMSFPITYQFVGSESAKWKLVGNAVCPLVSRALAVQLSNSLGLSYRSVLRSHLPGPLKNMSNLNTFTPASYDSPPKRRRMARFRSHPLKAASITVALTNYDMLKNDIADAQWRCFVTYGIGEGYKVRRIKLNQLNSIQRAVESTHDGPDYVERITNGFSARIAPARVLQDLYERNANSGEFLAPAHLLEHTKDLVLSYAGMDERVKAPPGTFHRDAVPKSQLFALYAVCQIASIAQRAKESK